MNQLKMSNIFLFKGSENLEPRIVTNVENYGENTVVYHVPLNTPVRSESIFSMMFVKDIQVKYTEHGEIKIVELYKQ